MLSRIAKYFDDRKQARETDRQIREAEQISLGTAGVEQEPGWFATDQEVIDLTDRETFSRFWKPGTRRAFLAEHVWEHLSPDDARTATSNCFEFLRPGGRLRIAVPDGHFPDQDYIEWVRPGGSGPGADDHKMLWTKDAMVELLRGAGFDAQPLEWWDEAGQFNAKPWSRQDGYIDRSAEHDSRNEGGQLKYTSLIVDGVKPS